ncbi:MAG: GNAT family N-acetyltransferase [Chthoniobacterales bacterium]
MDSLRTIPFRDGRARVVSLHEVRQIDAWKEAFAAEAKDHRFYEIVEETLDCGFEHRYLVLEDHAGRVRGIQPVFFVRQNLVEGVPALRRGVAAVRRFFPRFLTLRILMVGNAAGSGQLGVCTPGDEDWVAIALLATLESYARACGVSLVVFKDFPAQTRRTLARFAENGYTLIPSLPMTTLALTFTDFDDYLNTLGKATRKDLRRKFRKIAQAPIEFEVRTEVDACIDEIYPLYLAVYHRSAQKFERLTKDYFRALGARVPERTRFFIWRQHGRIVAFSVAFVHKGAIIDDYLGLDYSVALDLHLYFKTFRDIISCSLQEGLQTYRSSPLNYRPKLHLGCVLLPLDLYVMHTNRWLNLIFRHALTFLEPTRHDPVLQQFPNAHELA